MMDTVTSYQQQAIKAGSSCYYSLLLTPKASQTAIELLATFWHEIRKIPFECSDPGIARIKLHWWLDEISHIGTHKANHPLVKQFSSNIQCRQLPIAQYQAIILGTLQQLDSPQFKDNEQLIQYCESTQGNLMSLIAMVGGEQDPRALASARQLGIAMQLLDLLRKSRACFQKDFYYLTDDDATSHHRIDISHLAAKSETEEWHAAFSKLADKIQHYYDHALQQLTPEQKHRQKFNLIFAKLKMKLLAEIKADQFQVLSKAYHLTPLRKIWIAWREARRIGIGSA